MRYALNPCVPELRAFFEVKELTRLRQLFYIHFSLNY